MPDPQKGPDRAAMMKILLPAGAVAALVVLVAVLWSAGGGNGRPMSDGSNGAADDPLLFDMGDGLKYRDLADGSGPTCPADATVTVNYTGWLTDGTVFDSGTGVTFGLNAVIKGWQIGIPGMKVGGQRKLVIPPALAYGNQKSGKIPPGSTLIFEVTMADFKAGAGAGRPASKKLHDGTAPGDDDPKLIDLRPGLKYRDLKEGTGDAVREGATVTVHYTGWLLDGTTFDSSLPRGKPMTSPLSGLVKGWQYGIPGMKPGGIRKLVIGPDLAYGNQRQGDIPPNSTLVFEIEMIEGK